MQFVADSHRKVGPLIFEPYSNHPFAKPMDLWVQANHENLEIQKDLATLLPNLLFVQEGLFYFWEEIEAPLFVPSFVVAGPVVPLVLAVTQWTLLIDRIQVKTAYSNIQFVFILS